MINNGKNVNTTGSDPLHLFIRFHMFFMVGPADQNKRDIASLEI